MPRPRNDPVFRWDYTLVDDDGFDDGRQPRAATLACYGVAYPSTVHDVDAPTVADYQSGPWWIAQDAAVGGEYANSVLNLAVHLGLMPIIGTRHIAAATDI